MKIISALAVVANIYYGRGNTISSTRPTSSHIRVAHELGVNYFEDRFWPICDCR